jgi:hypothetical protein
MMFINLIIVINYRSIIDDNLWYFIIFNIEKRRRQDLKKISLQDFKKKSRLKRHVGESSLVGSRVRASQLSSLLLLSLLSALLGLLGLSGLPGLLRLEARVNSEGSIVVTNLSDEIL